MRAGPPPRLKVRPAWLILASVVLLPGFSCYELGPEPEMGPTLEATYLHAVILDGDLDNVGKGDGWALGGGLGSHRGGDIVKPEEFAELATGEEELEELRRRYPRGYQVGGDFQDWAAGSSVSYSEHEVDGTGEEVDYWRLRIGGGGAINPGSGPLTVDVELGECIHFMDFDEHSDILGFGLYAGAGLNFFPARRLGVGVDASAEAWWGEGGRISFTYVVGASLIIQF